MTSGGHFPTTSGGHVPIEQAAIKCLYLASMSLDLTGRGHKRWTNHR